MAKVVILSSGAAEPFDPWKHGTLLLLRHSAELDPFGAHQLIEDPAEADIILFAEMGTCGHFAERVRSHPWYRRFPEKCFLFDSADVILPVMPGIYASLSEGNYQADQTRTGFYLYVIDNAFIRHRPATGSEPYLASFVGSSNTHPVRSKLMELGRGDFLMKDTSASSKRMMFQGGPAERAQFWSEYADSIADSKFSLCPRGRGPGSIRLYETMKTGRVPVIISDSWHANEGVDWASCSLRVRESEVAQIPEILDQHASHAAEMGACARREWETHFSEPVRFHRVVELCLEMLRERKGSGRLRRWYHLRHIPLHLRDYFSSKKNLYRNNQGRIYW